MTLKGSYTSLPGKAIILRVSNNHLNHSLRFTGSRFLSSSGVKSL